MSTDSKFRTPEKNLSKSFNVASKRKSDKNSSDKDEEITTVFKDLHLSVLSKAVNISPDVNSITLGAKTEISPNEKKSVDDVPDASKTNFGSSILLTSTPEKTSKKDPKELKFRKSLENSINLKKTEKAFKVENCYSHQKLLNEFDAQRRLTVDKVMRERIQNMYDTGKLIKNSLEHLKQTKQEEATARRLLLERKILDDIHELEILNKPKREAQWAKDNLKEAQRIQERDQKVREAEEEAKKQFKALTLKKKQICTTVSNLLNEYNSKYKKVLESFKLCMGKPDLINFTVSQTAAVNKCAATCENLLKKCVQGIATNEDIDEAKKLISAIKSIEDSLSKKISETNKAFEDEALKKNDAPKSETEQLPASKSSNETPSLVASPSGAPSSSDLADCFDSRSLELYLNLKNLLGNYDKTIAPLLADESLKKFRFSCQKAVTIPVNAISPISSSHLSDKYLKLHNLLSGKVVEVGDIKVSASQHPLGIAYCKNLLAKKFVRQGDLTVSSKPDAAFSIATVLASLWVDFPDFGQLVLAHFQAACPYLAPVFMPQVEGQSDEEYHMVAGWVRAEALAEFFYLLPRNTPPLLIYHSGWPLPVSIPEVFSEQTESLGYHYSQNGEVEKQDSFLKRMSGIMRLYSALIISNVRQPGKMNPLGLSEGWRWISALLNLEPRPDICATLLYDFLEVAGNEMFRAYGPQFKKMLAYICQEYFPKLEKVTPSSAGGPLVRLEGFLQKILKDQSIPPPHGVLPPNFW